jgi:hypothetical protein
VLEHLFLIWIEIERDQTIVQVNNFDMILCEVHGIGHALGILVNFRGFPVFLDSVFLYMGVSEVVVIAR